MGIVPHECRPRRGTATARTASTRCAPSPSLAEPRTSGLRPDLLLLLGDQVYADTTTKEMQEFIRSRRDIHEEPGKELKDYEEYAHLYQLAWSDDANGGCCRACRAP